MLCLLGVIQTVLLTVLLSWLLLFGIDTDVLLTRLRLCLNPVLCMLCVLCLLGGLRLLGGGLPLHAVYPVLMPHQ